MSKWKCEICEKEFDNFHAQGFDNKIYCPLCFFKEKTNRLEKENERLKDKIDMAIKYYETNQQECVIGRNKDDKLIKEYYLPAQCSKKMLDILKEN